MGEFVSDVVLEISGWIRSCVGGKGCVWLNWWRMGEGEEGKRVMGRRDWCIYVVGGEVCVCEYVCVCEVGGDICILEVVCLCVCISILISIHT